MNKQNNKLSLYIIGGLVVLGVIALLAFGPGDTKQDITQNTDNSEYSASTLSAVETDFDFGSILMGDGDVSHQFEVKNEGTESIQIGAIYTSCACTTAYIIDKDGNKIGKFGMPGHKGLRKSADMEIAPGESVMVEAVYDPAFHGPSGVGLAERSIYIESNSSNSPKLELSFKAMVTR